MTQQQPHQGENEKHLLVRDMLRGLRHVQAPWYFEAQVLQRLRQSHVTSGGAAPPRGARWIPIIGAVGVVAIVAGYFVLNRFGQLPHEPTQPRPAAAPVPPDTSTHRIPPKMPLRESATLRVPGPSPARPRRDSAEGTTGRPEPGVLHPDSMAKAGAPTPRDTALPAHRALQKSASPDSTLIQRDSLTTRKPGRPQRGLKDTLRATPDTGRAPAGQTR
jgi:hypothetical protein